MKRLGILVLFLSTFVSAQDARSLAMGGVILPDRSAAAVNPAYAASGTLGARNSVPLPVGLLNALVSEKLKVGNEVTNENGDAVTTFDLLAAIDQASYLNTFIFNLPSSPEDINLSSDENSSGEPVLLLDFEGGSALSLGTVSYSNDFSLPINVAAGPVRVGLRPYAFVNGRAVPDAEFKKLFSTGTTGGSLDLNAAAEAGIALDVFYAFKVPASLLEQTGLAESNVYLGVRGAPFVGLARADAQATATVEADAETAEGSYTVEGTAFVSSIGVNGFGYGLVTDLGAAADVPVDGAVFSVGLGIRNLGFGIWSGETYTVFDDSEDNEGFSISDPVAASRSFFAPNFGVVLNGAYTLDNAGLPPLINSVVIAADVDFGAGGFGTHVGAEGVFGFESVNVAARAGIGYDDGFKLGLGGGVSFGSVSLDLALASHSAPFTNHQSFGIAASVGF